MLRWNGCWQPSSSHRTEIDWDQTQRDLEIRLHHGGSPSKTNVSTSSPITYSRDIAYQEFGTIVVPAGILYPLYSSSTSISRGPANKYQRANLRRHKKGPTYWRHTPPSHYLLNKCHQVRKRIFVFKIGKATEISCCRFDFCLNLLQAFRLIQEGQNAETKNRNCLPATNGC